jgi:UDP-N-acetylglucosamine transferase subunit ALG13
VIFLSVGTQLPFPRLIECVDSWASKNDSLSVFGQIGDTDITPSNFEYKNFLTADEFEKYSSKCQILIAHAGMGSIMTAIKYGKPIILFPRRACFGEHRNEHQLATVKHFSHLQNVMIANNESEIDIAYKTLIDRQIDTFIESRTLTNLRTFIEKEINNA